MDVFDLIQSEVHQYNYQVGDNNKHNSDFTIYGQIDDKALIYEIEKLKLTIQHQNELLKLKDNLLEQQAQNLVDMQKLLVQYERK